MSSIVDPLVERIGARVRAERTRRGWTMADLAAESGVSKAMIHRVERAQSSPTAVVLGKLSGALRLSVSDLVADDDRPGEADRPAPRRAAQAPVWHDPATGYRRRPVASARFPVDVTEVVLPPGQVVPYPASAFAFLDQMVWVLDGDLAFRDGDTLVRLGPGDAYEVGAPADREFRNEGDVACRYVVVVVPRDVP